MEMANAVPKETPYLMNIWLRRMMYADMVYSLPNAFRHTRSMTDLAKSVNMTLFISHYVRPSAVISGMENCIMAKRR